MKGITVLCALTASLAIVGNLAGAEKQKGRPVVLFELRAPASNGENSTRPQVEWWKTYRDLNLTDDQKAEFDELEKEYRPKLRSTWPGAARALPSQENWKTHNALCKELRSKIQAIFTPKQFERLKKTNSRTRRVLPL
jgi:hypothetical protein